MLNYDDNTPDCPRQTRFVVEYFNEPRDLFFVEIGANDGTSWSNSYYLERELGWNGICIEPHPTMFEKLSRDRNCVCLNVAVGDTEAEVDFFSIEGDWPANMLSGVLDNYESQHKERVMEEYKKYGGTASIVKVKCLPFGEILKRYNVTRIDYLSIDTEGSEIPILKSIDFASVDIGLLGVEVNYDQTPVDDILAKHGYKFIKKVEGDAFYSK